MKILFTGGGTGGHFYPLIAVAEATVAALKEEKILHYELFYMGPEPYDKEALFENQITFLQVPAGKLRIYPSFRNVVDALKTVRGILKAIRILYRIYPDIIFSKGGYASFPALVAARLFGIPVIIHESDSVPGRVNRWAGKFARFVGLSYQEAAPYFPKEKVAWIGQPIREGLLQPITTGAHEYLGLEETIPVVFIIGGSSGAQAINSAIIQALPKLVEEYQVIHQVGRDNFDTVKEEVSYTLAESQFAQRYKPFGFLNELALRMAAGAADVVITRAGSMLFEIAGWQRPAIVIPIEKSNGDHQKRNAFAYARAGAGIVILEDNLGTNVLLNELRELTSDLKKRKVMQQAAAELVRPDAAKKIAEQLLVVGLKHEG